MLDDWPFGSFMCPVVPFTQSVSVFVSSFTMTAIAVDRYQVISTPLHTRAEFRDGYWKLVLIWSLSLLLSVPWAVYHSVKPTFTCTTHHRCQVTFASNLKKFSKDLDYQKNSNLFVNLASLCFMLTTSQLLLSTSSRAWVSLVMFLIQFLAPLGVTMAAYTLISYHLWGAGHIGAATQQQQLRRLASRRRTIKMLVLVVILFGVSWLPLNLYHLISDWSR